MRTIITSEGKGIFADSVQCVKSQQFDQCIHVINQYVYKKEYMWCIHIVFAFEVLYFYKILSMPKVHWGIICVTNTCALCQTLCIIIIFGHKDWIWQSSQSFSDLLSLFLLTIYKYLYLSLLQIAIFDWKN